MPGDPDPKSSPWPEELLEPWKQEAERLRSPRVVTVEELERAAEAYNEDRATQDYAPPNLRAMRNALESIGIKVADNAD